MSGPDLSAFSLWDLYRGEVESHSLTLNEGLLALEQSPGDLDRVKALMRAAHSIKGAARVVQHALAVDVAHAMEDRLVAAQEGRLPLAGDDIQSLLEGVDLLERLSPADEAEKEPRVAECREAAAQLIDRLSRPSTPTQAPALPEPASPGVAGLAATGVAGARATGRRAGIAEAEAARDALPGALGAGDVGHPIGDEPAPSLVGPSAQDRAIRLTAQAVTRMMGLTSEAAVATRWLAPFSGGLLDLKRELTEVTAMLHRLEDSLFAFELGDEIALSVNALQARLERTRVALTEHIAGLETFALRQEVLTDRLYREVQATRMRPFGDLVEGFPRLVRDLARQLGKKVRLEVDGKATEVDRDVAALLDAPLNHLLRNAVDHGIEMPDERMQAGKPEAGRIRLSAFHRAGMLRVVVEDDGRGVDVTALRHKVAERGLTDAATAERLSQDEVLAFLFLPGFSTAVRVSDVSGRGVGLDVVQEAMKTVGGHIEVVNAPGRGLTFAFDLPLTLSVLQALVVEVGGEPYAIPLTRIERIAERARDQVRTVEGREYVALRVFRSGGTAPPRGESPLEEQLVGLVTARQVLGVAGEHPVPGKVPIVAIREGHRLFGLAVDRIVGEQFIVVRPLDPRLGKVKDVSAAALMVDGTPLLVLDVDDLGRSIDQILTGGRLAPLAGPAFSGPAKRKRVLVVDDSITVREIERQLLEAHGYAVDVAVDGVDGWNAVRTGHYDLVVTDVDMPRLDGVELVRRMRADRRYGTLPIMIVSYKDRDEDRLRGLDAGASYYLPKSSFQDDRFLIAVDELIGHAEAP